MMGNLIHREMHGHLSSLRFRVGFVAVCLTMVVVVLMRVPEERARWQEYQLAVSSQEAFLDQYAHANRLGPMIRPVVPPSALGTLIGSRTQAASFETLYSDPLRAVGRSIDLGFVVAILLSLFAIILSYDAFSGERERGTLRILMTFPVSRAQVVASKAVAGAIALGIAMLVAFLLVGVIVLAVGAVQWNSSEIAAAVAIAATSFVYVVAFFILGMAVSAFSRSSSTAIVAGLFAWIILVLVVPAGAPSLAQRLRPADSANVIEAQMREVEAERQDRLRQVRASLEAQGLDLDELQARFDDRMREINDEAAQARRRLQGPYEARLASQAQLGWLLAAASPYTSYVAVATSLASTGIERESMVRSQAAAFQREFWDFARPRIDELRTQFPGDYLDRKLDLNGRPEFRLRELSLSERVSTWTMVNLVVLSVFVTVFFAIAFVRFLVYDVR